MRARCSCSSRVPGLGTSVAGRSWSRSWSGWLAAAAPLLSAFSRPSGCTSAAGRVAGRSGSRSWSVVVRKKASGRRPDPRTTRTALACSSSPTARRQAERTWSELMGAPSRAANAACRRAGFSWTWPSRARARRTSKARSARGESPHGAWSMPPRGPSWASGAAAAGVTSCAGCGLGACRSGASAERRQRASGVTWRRPAAGPARSIHATPVSPTSSTRTRPPATPR